MSPDPVNELLNQLAAALTTRKDFHFTKTDVTFNIPDAVWRRAYAGLAMSKMRPGDYNTYADMCDDAFNEADAMLAEAKKREEEKLDGPNEPE